MDNAKAEILNTAEADTRQQAKEETKALLQEYAGYLQEKIDFEESYAPTFGSHKTLRRQFGKFALLLGVNLRYHGSVALLLG